MRGDRAQSLTGEGEVGGKNATSDRHLKSVSPGVSKRETLQSSGCDLAKTADSNNKRPRASVQGAELMIDPSKRGELASG